MSIVSFQNKHIKNKENKTVFTIQDNPNTSVGVKIHGQLYNLCSDWHFEVPIP